MRWPLKREFWRKPIVLTVLVVAVIGVAGGAGYYVYQQQGCSNTLVGCGPVPFPAIQSAQAYVNSVGEGGCQIASSSTVAICSIFMKAGVSGNVTLNVFNKNQQSWQSGNRAQFLVYSSDDQSVNFTSIPTCAYTSAPTFDSPSCSVDMQTQMFQFNFEISPSYVAPPLFRCSSAREHYSRDLSIVLLALVHQPVGSRLIIQSAGVVSKGLSVNYKLFLFAPFSPSQGLQERLQLPDRAFVPQTPKTSNPRSLVYSLAHLLVQTNNR